MKEAPEEKLRAGRTLVAMNVLRIARRELESGSEPQSLEQLADLYARIRAGESVDLAALKEHVAAKLRVSSPACLEQCK